MIYTYYMGERGRRYMLRMANLMMIVFIVGILYFKFFSDEMVDESMQVSTVVEVTPIEGKGIGGNSTKVKVELEDGAKANLLLQMDTPSVGDTLEVTVRTFDSGKRQVSYSEY